MCMQLTQYLEMVRCGANAAWMYTAQLEEQSRRLEEGKFITKEVERLVASLQDASVENSGLIASRDETVAKLTEITTSRDEMAAKLTKLEEDAKAKKMEKRVAESQLKASKDKCVELSRENKAMKQMCDDWKQKEEAWLKEKATLEERCSFTDTEKEAFKETY